MARQSRKLSRGEKKLFLVTGFAIAFVFAFGAWRSYVDAIPDVQIPTPKMPNPNAYDFYQQAGQTIIPANLPVDPLDDPIPPEQAAKKRYTLSSKRAWLRRNAAVITLSRRAFLLPCYLPPVRTFRNNTQDFPWENKAPSRGAIFRKLGRFWMVVVHTRREENNLCAAAQSALAIYRIGCASRRGGILVDHLSSDALCHMSCHELEDLLPHLNTRLAKTTARQLERLIENRQSFSHGLQEEEYCYQAGLIEVFQDGTWQHWFDGTESGEPDRWLKQAFLRSVSKQAVIKSYSDYMDALVAQAKRPYKQRILPKIGQIMTFLRVTEFTHIFVMAARAETRSNLILVSLALRAFRLEHGRYPRTLQELVPQYLKAVPADPFGAGEALRYRLINKTATKYSLYSIGPDGADNRGQIIQDMSRTGQRRFSAAFESKGDFVAGINY